MRVNKVDHRICFKAYPTPTYDAKTKQDILSNNTVTQVGNTANQKHARDNPNASLRRNARWKLLHKQRANHRKQT